MTDLSIIVVCYRGWGKVRKCLQSLHAFRGEDFSFEVIVVDNNSGDDEFSKLESLFPRFCYITNKSNGGYGFGNNTGIRRASGEYLLILNPDTVAEESEVSRLIRCARTNPDYSVISCRQVNSSGKEVRATGDFPALYNLTGFQRSIIKLAGKGNKRISEGMTLFPDWISGSVVLLRRDLYLELDGFYEGYWMYFEDVDLCRRIKNNGGKIAFLRDVTIEHNHGGSSRIDTRTTSLTKTEVHISRHVYVARNFTGLSRLAAQTFLVINNLISAALMATPGLIFFYIPGLFVRTLIFSRLASYYFNALTSGTWISPRSVLPGNKSVKKS